MRHDHVIFGMSLFGVAGIRNTKPSFQGFITNYGRVVDRAEARIIAIEAKQYDRIPGSKDNTDLYSEDVWAKSIVRGHPNWTPPEETPVEVPAFLLKDPEAPNV